MILDERTKQLCEKAADLNTVRLLDELKHELRLDIIDNNIRDINIEKLTVRQQNAIHNWVIRKIYDRTEYIEEYMKGGKA